jgi:hypothetical protein
MPRLPTNSAAPWKEPAAELTMETTAYTGRVNFHPFTLYSHRYLYGSSGAPGGSGEGGDDSDSFGDDEL